MTDEQRRDISNGIWLCRTHAREIDGDEKRYPSELLHEWKREHERWVETGKMAEMLSAVPSYPAIVRYPTRVVDEQIQKEISIMRRGRFFSEFHSSEHALKLAEKVLDGEFEGGSDAEKSRALAWCSRVLAIGENGAKADEILRQAALLGQGPEVTVAEAFRIAASNGVEGALGKLTGLDSPYARSAAFMIVSNGKGASAAIDWLSAAGLNHADLDADGKFFLLIKLIELGHWSKAFENSEAIQADDFIQTPILFHAAAMANLAQSVPDELRSVLPQQVPFQAADFPLASSQSSLKHRRKAQESFAQCALAARDLGCAGSADIAEDLALWLELRDPEGQITGRKKLQASMREPKHSLRRLQLAMQFGLSLNLKAVEREIEHQTALSGGQSRDAAIARFWLAFVQRSPKDVTDYIDRHRAQLQKHLDSRAVGVLEAEMLVKAGLLEQAEERFASLINEGLPEVDQQHLRRIISEATATDPIEIRKAKFEKDKRLDTLFNLVKLLEEQGDWSQLCHFGSLLFERTKALPDAVRLARALDEVGRYSELAELLRSYPEFLDQSDDLQMLWSWSLYGEGLLAESASALRKLRAKRDHPADRALAAHLSISSGDWNALLPLIESEWDNREKRDADDLMRTAHLAYYAGSLRAKELLYQAVTKASQKADILVAGYSLATKAGWEDEEVAQWLQKAAELSDDSGPLRRVSMEDILKQAPEWNQREADTWQQVNAGNIPLCVAARILNKSLIDISLLPAVANSSESDVRRRIMVPAYSGARGAAPCNYRVVGMEATALLTLSILGLFESALELFDQVFIPHATLDWLFDEKKEVSFHQPSRIRNAAKLRELLASDLLKSVTVGTEINSDLAAEVGQGLASLIAEATAGQSDDRQRLVVRPSPVHRVSSLMNEEADLSPYYSQLCSCSSVVNKLKQKGQLTVTEENRARSYLNLHEKQWPMQPEICDGAVLYLDDISVTYLQHTGLLEKLKPAGLEAYISIETVEEVNALLRYEQLASKVGEVIERLRASLAKGIWSGKIKLGQRLTEGTEEEPKLRNHPTFAVFDLGNVVEAIVVDDRAINKSRFFDQGTDRIPILTTDDLLDGLYLNGGLTLQQTFDKRTELRRAGYLFVPVTKDEFELHLSVATVTEGSLIETAELKAIRENLLRVRMSKFLQLPLEAAWINSLMQTFLDTLKAQWRSEIDEATARARADWLLKLMDPYGWAHCFIGDNVLDSARFKHGLLIMRLLATPLNLSSDVRERYLRWVDEAVVGDIKDQDPELYSWVIGRIKQLFAEIVDMSNSKEAP